MVVVMEERASETQIEQVVARLVELGMDVHRSTGVSRTVLGVVGQKRPDPGLIEMMEGVHEVMRISEPYKLASKTFKPEGTVVTIGDVRIGGDEVVVMAGPCSAETDAQVRASAAAVRKAGAKIFRGGAFKPRSSPYSFQGLGKRGLELLALARDDDALLASLANRSSLFALARALPLTTEVIVAAIGIFNEPPSIRSKRSPIRDSPLLFVF